MESKKNNFYKKHIFMCTFGKTCSSLDKTQEIFNKLKNAMIEKGLSNDIRINKAGCMNWCSAGPVLVVYPEGKWFSEIEVKNLDNIIEYIISN